MEPEPDSPLQRVERSLVSVWCYITEAVSRFLRAQPAEEANNDPASVEDSIVQSEPPDRSHTGADDNGEEADEEESTVSFLSSSSPVVAWERCAADIVVKPKEEGHENKEDAIKEQLDQTGNDQLAEENATARQGRQENTEIEKSDTREESEAPGKDREGETGVPGHMLLKKGVSDWMDSSEGEERVSTGKLDDCQQLKETLEDIQEDDGEETAEGLEEARKIEECTSTEKEEINEETEKQGDNKASGVILGDADICEDAKQLSLGNEICTDEKTKAVKIQLPMSKDSSEDETADENVQINVFEEDLNTTENYQIIEKESELNKSRRTIEEARVSTQNQDVQQTEQNTAEFTFKEEDMLVTIMQTTSEKHVAVKEISGDVYNEVEENEKPSCEFKNLTEGTQQAETQLLFCKELSGVTEDGRVQVAVTEEQVTKKSATHQEPEQKRNSRAAEHEHILTRSVTSTEDDQGTGKEQITQKGNDCAEKLITEDMTAHHICVEREEDKNKDQENVGPKSSAEVTCEETEKTGDVAEEDPVNTARLEDFAKEIVDMEEGSGEVQEDNGDEHEDDFEEESEVKQCTFTEQEDSNGDRKKQRDGEAAAVMLVDAYVCEEASQLSPAHDDSEEGTQPVETKHVIHQESSEDESTNDNVQMTVLDKESLTTSARYQAKMEESEQNKSSRAVDEVQLEENVLPQSITISKEHQSTGVEQFSQTKHDKAGQDYPNVDDAKRHLDEESGEIMEEDEDMEDESEVKQCLIEEDEDRHRETEELRESEASALMLEDANICEGATLLREKPEAKKWDTGEEHETPEMDGERATGGSEEDHVTKGRLDDYRTVVKTLEDIQKHDGEETGEGLEEERKTEECTQAEGWDNNEGTGEQRYKKASGMMLGDAEICGDATQLSLVKEICTDEKTKDVETQLPVCKESSEKEQADEDVQMNVSEEQEEEEEEGEDNDLNIGVQHLKTEEESEQDKSRWTIKEENVSTQNFTSSKGVQQVERETTEFTFKEEDMLVTIMQTSSEKDVPMEGISAGVDYEISDEVMLYDKESCIEGVCTTRPVTVKAEGASVREINSSFNNIPLGVIEGPAALSHEVNIEACEETPEAVPEHNNELELDENTTQRFLEGGNTEEIRSIHLPEEVEVFKRSGAGGGEYLLIRLGSTEDSNDRLNLVVEEKAGALKFVEDPEKQKRDNINLELEGFSEEQKVELLDTSMKTEIKQSDEEFETYSAEETAVHDGDKTAELGMTRLSEEAGEGGCEGKEVLAADEVYFTEEFLKKEDKMTENYFGSELVQSFSLQDDGNLKHSEEIKHKSIDESLTELLQTGFDTDKQGGTYDGEPGQVIQDSNGITSLQLAVKAADLITGQFPLSQHHMANNQAPLRTPEITTGTERADESETAPPEGPSQISAEETKHKPESFQRHSDSPAEEHQDVIEEDILDLWIETVMSKDTDTIEEFEPGLQEDRPVEESGDASAEKKQEEVMEANSAEPASMCETETSLTNLDSGFLDQPFSEILPIKSGDAGSLADINDNSQWTCDFSASNSVSALIEETAEMLHIYPREEGASSGISSCPEPRHPNREGGTAQEMPEETNPERAAETDTVCGDYEAADLTSPTKKADSELIEATVSNILDEIPESGQHREDLEALLEEGSVLTESSSGSQPQTEPEQQQFPLVAPEHRWSENLIRSFPAPSRTEVEDDTSEVDGRMFDFAVQRSRIAVKNPRARPPTDPRSLIHKPSVEPTPSLPVPGKVPPGVPLGGLGIGIKLPGIGAGFPVLKKTQRTPKDEQEAQSQKESEEKKEEEEKNDAGEKDEAPKRPKWMPPGQPGFGNPLMSELKSKLKKTLQE